MQKYASMQVAAIHFHEGDAVDSISIWLCINKTHAAIIIANNYLDQQQWHCGLQTVYYDLQCYKDYFSVHGQICRAITEPQPGAGAPELGILPGAGSGAKKNRKEPELKV